MEFWHMSGAGNDFVVTDARGKDLDFSALAQDLCGKTGADGFMALDHSAAADFRLHFYNSDGSRGEMCGNGARCICRFAYDRGIAGPEMVVQTDAGPVPGWRLSENQYRVQMNLPSRTAMDRLPGVDYIELGCPGSPHGVLEAEDLEFDQLDARRARSAALRRDPAFPKGANISYYRLLSQGTARVLTYERGVEDYTMACGTGCSSVAVSLWLRGRLPGGTLEARCRGGVLTVQVEGTGQTVQKLLLTGPAEVLSVFTD